MYTYDVPAINIAYGHPFVNFLLLIIEVANRRVKMDSNCILKNIVQVSLLSQFIRFVCYVKGTRRPPADL
jgi:hypothetical protein